MVGICGLHAVGDRASYPQRDSNTEARIGDALQKKSDSKNEKAHLGPQPVQGPTDPQRGLGEA